MVPNQQRPDAWKHVAGLTIVNVTTYLARDIQQRAMTGDPTATIATARVSTPSNPWGLVWFTATNSENLSISIRTPGQHELRSGRPHEQLYSRIRT